MPFHFTCENCGRSFTRRQSKPARFCGHPCKATFHGTAHMMTAEDRDRIATQRRGTGRGDGYVKLGGRHEHRVVAERVLGRPLAPGEIVAHKDRQKPNNAAANLVVFPNRAAFARDLMLKLHKGR